MSKLKMIYAVERKNLTEQDEVRLLDMDRAEFITENHFKQAVKEALKDGYRAQTVRTIIGTFADWIKFARLNHDFEPSDYTVINVEIYY